MSVKRIRPGARLSGASTHHGLCWLAGQTADDLTQDVKGQTKQILDKIDKFLSLMEPLGLVEISRTGVVAITRGPDAM